MKWLVGALMFAVVGALFYFDPPTPGRAFTKNQSSATQQDQGSGSNHKRTSGEFSW